MDQMCQLHHTIFTSSWMHKETMVVFNFSEFSIFFLEIALLFFLFFLFFHFISGIVNAGIGENVTVISELEIGKSPPIVQNIDIEEGSINLVPNTTKLVNCSIVIVDYNGETTIINVTSELFDNSTSAKGDSDNNNEHYTNSTCFINYTYGDENTVLATCLFDLWYYSNAGVWNCSVNIMDSDNMSTNESNITTVEPLLALAVPDSIDYGLVNATEVSNENITNITNLGNVMFNISFLGYAISEGDGLAMNCTLGGIKNISIEHEKYNLTESNPGVLTPGQADDVYKNLTANTLVMGLNLDKRTNNNFNDVWNATYWRIYVPLGVAGSCQGNIIFGAIQSSAS